DIPNPDFCGWSQRRRRRRGSSDITLGCRDGIETEPLGDPGFDQLDDTGDGGLRILHLHEIQVALSFGRIEIGNGALVDAMIAGDGLWAACRNTSVRRTTGTALDAMM